ncbi:MAG: ATP-binding cassette domain-containing protein [Bacilli bacterium]
MINIKELYYSYDKNFVLRIEELDFKCGVLNFIVGPNGSGKTTLLRLMNDELKLQKGKILINDEIQSNLCVKKKLLYLSSGDNVVPEFLSCYEFVQFMCKLYNVNFNQKKYLQQITDYKMGIFHKELIENYSHGMKKKVLLIAAALIDPSVLIIDETLNGLDIESKIIAKKQIFNSISNGKLVIIATHDLNLVNELGGRIILMLKGRIFYDGELSDLKKEFMHSSLELIIQRIVEEIYNE